MGRVFGTTVPYSNVSVTGNLNTSSALDTYLNNKPVRNPSEWSGNTLGEAIKQTWIDAFRPGTPGSSTFLEDPADALAMYLNGSTGNGIPTGKGIDDPGYPTGGGGASYSAPSTPQELQYIDAPYAELYGMDASTAYQEALANTAYQRKVKDLKAAGLNPVLGYSGAGAASFYGTSAPAVSSSGGASYGSSGSGETTSGLSDKQKDTLIRNLPNVIGGVVTMIKGPSAGAATTSIGNAIGNIIRYWN